MVLSKMEILILVASILSLVEAGRQNKALSHGSQEKK